MPLELSDEAITKVISELDSTSSSLSSSSSSSTSSTMVGGEETLLKKGKKMSKNSDPSSIKGMLSALNHHHGPAGGTKLMKESIKTFSNSDGSDEIGDLMIVGEDNKNLALAKLKELVECVKDNNARKGRGERASKKKNKNSTSTSTGAQKWEFLASPHEYFGKSLDDTFAAFVEWAKSTNANDDFCDNENAAAAATATTTTTTYNVSKAFRRLEAYAEWMEDAREVLTESPLTGESVKIALDAWSMNCSIDKHGKNFCWWIDLRTVDIEAVKNTIPHNDSLRAFTWYCHYIMYDECAQKNGVLFFENLDNMGFVQAMTLMPRKLKVKLDRLTIGTLPIRVKAFYMLEAPTWLDIFVKFISMFMSKKMKERLVVLKDNSKVEELVGKEAIPKNFGNLGGTLHVTPVYAGFS